MKHLMFAVALTASLAGAQWRSFGGCTSGTHGCPTLSWSGVNMPGWAITVHGARLARWSFGALWFAPRETPIASCPRANVLPSLSWPVATDGGNGIYGLFTQTISLPNDPALRNTELMFQILILDAQSSCGASSSLGYALLVI